MISGSASAKASSKTGRARAEGSSASKASAVAGGAGGMEEDDEDEDDSDYNPDSDPEAQDDEEEKPQKPDLMTELGNASRKRKAQSVWEELREEEEARVRARMQTLVAQKRLVQKQEGAVGLSTAAKAKNRKLDEMMKSIFGASTAPSVKPSSDSSELVSTTSPDIAAILRESARNVLKATKVVETKKFAGQSVTVERTVKPGEASVPKQKPVAAQSGLEKVLVDIKGPQTVSTVSKSASDWESFKDKEGIQDDLAAATKDGYLHRKDFLERCDVREHDKELEARPVLKPTV